MEKYSHLRFLLFSNVEFKKVCENPSIGDHFRKITLKALLQNFVNIC